MNGAEDLTAAVAEDEQASDPYGDLPLLEPTELRDGDVLMLLGQGWSDIGGISLPVSWLIRTLDGGAYSHSTVLSHEGSDPVVWDHSEDWSLGPVPLSAALKDHAWCHVYRLNKHGESVGGTRYPAAPLLKRFEAHRGDGYDKLLLLLSGVIAVLARMPEDETQRSRVRLALEALVAALEWWINQQDVRRGMLICTAVAGLAYWEALNERPHDYALSVDLSRRGTPGGDADWDALVDRIRALLAQLQPTLINDLALRQRSAASNAQWVDVGGPLLPANMVTPSDLEFSQTLERVGRLAIPKA